MIRALLVISLALVSACATPPPLDPVLESATSEELFVSATALIYGGMVKLPADDLEDLLEAENNLPKLLRAEILRYSKRGADLARVLIEKNPKSAEAHLLLALHLAYQGIAQGKASAFFEGIPDQIEAAFTQAQQLNERVMSAGPLLAEGRFRTIVPFPYCDINAAQKALSAALEIAPVKQTFFYLGDAYAWQGKIKEARIAWNRALSAKSGERTVTSAPFIDQLVNRRLRMTR